MKCQDESGCPRRAFYLDGSAHVCAAHVMSDTPIEHCMMLSICTWLDLAQTVARSSWVMTADQVQLCAALVDAERQCEHSAKMLAAMGGMLEQCEAGTAPDWRTASGDVVIGNIGEFHDQACRASDCECSACRMATYAEARLAAPTKRLESNHD